MQRPKLECFVRGSTIIDNDMLPQPIHLKHSILKQLQQVYKRALADSRYPSALKSIELSIKMLPLLESAPSSISSLANLDIDGLKKIIEELETA